MKTYKLEIVLDDKGLAVHEKTSEGITTTEARQIISVFEEYKTRFIQYIIFLADQQTTDLKKQTKQ